MATVVSHVDSVTVWSRGRFVSTTFVSSFLLFLVQPMIARLALPRLGGAPSVWNSAMLVYQTLLLAGYAYAHLLGRFSPRTQAGFHVTMLLLASLTLPIGLSASVPPPEANPFLWVPSLLLVSIGPLFFVISAHAPLLQRWFAVSDGSDPYPLYAASNLGSFGGLIAYPLLVEPYTSIGQQRWLWSGAYAVLILLVASCAFGIRNVKVRISSHDCAGSRPSWRMIGGWVVLAAVPSGLILSTTLHITTDILAMPLLWVLPLGAYLLSFSIAFSEQSRAKDVIIRLSPLLLLFGSLALFRELSGFALLLCVLSIVNLFTLSVALHGRLFERRPPPEHLTLFYLAMSLGGVLGGVFCALVAPLTFDWTYEHLLLLTAAAWLICAPNPFSFMARLWVEDVRAKPIAMLALSLLGVLVLLGTNLFGIAHSQSAEHLGIMGVLLIAVLAIGNRILFTTAVAALLITAGAWEQLESSLTQGKMTRSFFGIYSIREGGHHSRLLAHGTTVHGMQNLGSPNRERMPTSYYAPASGVGLAMQAAPTLFGPNARIAVIGLGAGTLACYAKPEQQWTFYEIDPAVVEIARDPNRFTFLSRCKPDAQIEVGDARLLIEREATGSADLLVVDAFSSDAIPMHLLTREAFAEYGRLLSPNGLLLVHISNRYMDLEPVVSAAAASSHWAAVIRRYRPSAAAQARNEGPSDWVAMSRSTKSLQLLTQRSAAHWTVPITPQSFRPWTDDHASILPLIHWGGKTS